MRPVAQTPPPDTNDYPTESYSVIAGEDCPCSDPACTPSARHVFVWPEKPFTLNQANAKRWVWIEARKQWREAFTLMARGSTPLAWCNVTVDHLVGTRRNVDVAACTPSFKAALDGVVLAGVLVDDTAAIVRRVTFNAPVYAGYDALIITLEGPAATTGAGT